MNFGFGMAALDDALALRERWIASRLPRGSAPAAGPVEISMNEHRASALEQTHSDRVNHDRARARPSTSRGETQPLVALANIVDAST